MASDSDHEPEALRDLSNGIPIASSPSNEIPKKKEVERPPPSLPVSAPRPLPLPPARVPMPRPNCTHIVMDYFYTTVVPCDHCGVAPLLGWLYVCQQDPLSEAIARTQMETLNQLHDKDQLPTRVEELQACGMSKSILDQIKQGNVFDPFQIEVLKNQKVNMLRTMDKQLSLEQNPWTPHMRTAETASTGPKLEEDSLHRNVTMRTGARTARSATSKLVDKLGHYRKRSEVIPKCGFKCCHACRPYFRDRAYIDLEAALDGDVDPARFAPQVIPVSDAFHVRNLGLRPVVRPRYLTSQESYDEDAISSDASFLSTTDEASDSDVYDDISPATEDSVFAQQDNVAILASRTARPKPSPYPSQNGSKPAHATDDRTADGDAKSKDADADVNGLLRRLTRNITPKWLPTKSKSQASLTSKADPLNMRHAKSHHALGTAGKPDQEDPESADLGLQAEQLALSMSTDRPELVYMRSLYGDIGRFYAPRSTSYSEQPSPGSDKSHGSASDDEIFVDGGIALTEQAVENHVPDLITQV